MKITLLAIVAGLAGFSYAQTFTGVPACAQPCVLNYLSGGTIAGCNSLDVACICSNSSFLSGIACCLAAACDAADQAAAVAYAQNICKTNGVTNLPSAVFCASTVSSTPTASSSATVATTSGSSNGTTVKTTSTASNVAVITSSSTLSSTSSSSTPSATKNGAAIQNVAGMSAGIVGGLAGLAAALL